MYYLFNRFTIREFSEEAAQTLVESFNKLTQREIGDASVEELKNRLVRPALGKIPVLSEDSKVIEFPQYELPIDPRNLLSGANRSRKIVRRVKISYPYTGDYRFFFIEPTRHSCGMPFGQVEKEQLSFIYDYFPGDPHDIYDELDTANLMCIYAQLEQLRKDVLPVNQRLRKLTQKWIEEKLEKPVTQTYQTPVIKMKSKK